MKLKRFGTALLFPPLLLLLFLTPVATTLLVGAMLFLGTDSVIAYASYVLAAYTLTAWCFRIPSLVRRVGAFQRENRFAIRWRSDERLRIKLSLYASLLGNAVYAAFQLWLGFYHKTFWFASLGVYYVCLAMMRFFLLAHTRRYAPREKMQTELVRYRACGWSFLVMNLALSVIVFFMVYWRRSFSHHMITAIAMAAYTFFSFTMAIIGIVTYRKYNSPVYAASKAIGLAAASVSMLTLTSTMLTTFRDGRMDAKARTLMLGGVGVAVVLFVVVTALFMIIRATKELNRYKDENPHGK